MMKTNTLFFRKSALLLLTVLLVACGSRVPIAPVEQAILDDRIVGSWMATSPEGNETIYLTIYRFNPREYFIGMREEKSDTLKSEGEVLPVRAYIIEIENRRFLNLQLIRSLDSEERVFYFYQYDFNRRDQLVVRALNDMGSTRISHFEHSDSLYLFIRTHLADEKFYDTPVVFTRQEEQDP